MKPPKPIRERNRSIQPTATQPLSAAAAVPKAKAGHHPPGTDRSPNFTSPAPAITGRLIRNTKRAASARSMRSHRAVVRATPARETPGWKARPWTAPSRKASPNRRSVGCRSPGLPSAILSNTPKTASQGATNQIRSPGSPPTTSTTTPITAVGTAVATSSHATLASPVRGPRFTSHCAPAPR